MLTIQPVSTPWQIRKFVLFPHTIYRNDPNWVAPLIGDQVKKLTPGKNPFWNTAERQLFMAYRGKQPAGTIAAIIDHARNRLTGENSGIFGFFECINDPQVSAALFSAAAEWLRGKGMQHIIGPYNPTSQDEPGILIEGFNTRPALVEAHHPPYYQHLVESAGYYKHSEMVARLITVRPEMHSAADALPQKLVRIAARVMERADFTLRPFDPTRWEEEVRMAARLFNDSLSGVPGHIPFLEEDFLTFCNGFKPYLDPQEALIAEINGVPVGFGVALPDLYEVLHAARGRLFPFGAIKMWRKSRRITRATFKIIMVLPEYHNRGIEAVLIYTIAESLYKKGYREVDLSLTGEENIKSMRFQEHLGFPIYRRYRVYTRDL